MRGTVPNGFACSTMLVAALAALHQVAYSQVPYPPAYVQGETWTSGTHEVTMPTKIITPGDPAQPTLVSGSAQVDITSGTAIELTEGFYDSGHTGDGYFLACVEDVGEMVLIAPDPVTAISNGTVHVPKWEKLELGIRLPQTYQDAIESFFQHYYPTASSGDYTASPSNTQELYDLNPYADDSLQLVMTLTKPSGVQAMKWGFYMKEAMWDSPNDNARLTEDFADPLHPYHVRFRIAPDEVGIWQFNISIEAPFTNTPAGDPLPHLQYSTMSFVCDPPLSDNKGYLSVNPNNQRVMQFEDGTPFIGLGVDLADQRHGNFNESNTGEWWYTFYQRDLDDMQESMGLLNAKGGNFVRMFLLDKMFAPEYVNLGVYDKYRIPVMCELSESLNDLDCDRGWTTGYQSSGQYQSWAFDQMLDAARANNIYVQLCIDPYMGDVAYQKFGWGAHPYVLHFLEDSRQPPPYSQPPYNPVDMKYLFYKNGDPVNKNDGVFYYWKRKYKYIMARWGYSVNIAAIEPFNETDQLISFRSGTTDLTSTPPVLNDCNDDLDLIEHRDICRENRADWNHDPQLRSTIDTWVTDIAEYVRGNVVLNDPVNSPLGEDHRLFLMSYAGGPQYSDLSHYQSLNNPAVDLMDVHKGIYHQKTEPGHTLPTGSSDGVMKESFDMVQHFRGQYPISSSAPRKPFNHGEFNHYTNIAIPIAPNEEKAFELEKLFHNYDVSFHNELWASVFSGKFAAGTTWHWERVFWWEDALEVPPPDPSSWVFQLYQPTGEYSNDIYAVNNIEVNNGRVEIANSRLHHHFEPLSYLLNHPTLQASGFFQNNISVYEFHSIGYQTECYYMMDPTSTIVVGWVHNLNAWTMNNYYLTSSEQNFAGCTAPNVQEVFIGDLMPNTDYHITWFPTRVNSNAYPASAMYPSSNSGVVTLDMNSEPLGGTFSNGHLDTLHADYAFIMALNPVPKNLMAAMDTVQTVPWDFTMYPNPTRNQVRLNFTDDSPKNILLLDPLGRTMQSMKQIAVPSFVMSTNQLASGVYLVSVSDGLASRVKKLIVQQ